MSGRADEGFGAHPFGEIARATEAAQERSLELAQAWSGSLQQLVSDQAEGGRAALEALTSTLAAGGEAVDTATTQLGFRCLVRDGRPAGRPRTPSC